MKFVKGDKMAIRLIEQTMINTRNGHCNTVDGTRQLNLIEVVVLFCRSGEL